MDEEAWYRRQIIGLKKIIEDGKMRSGEVSREYLIEKLDMILSKRGVNFHPSIERYLSGEIGKLN